MSKKESLELNKIFMQLDKNSNGFLERSELIEGYRSVFLK